MGYGRKVRRKQSWQTTKIAMKVGIRDRLVAGNDSICNSKILNHRYQLFLTFDNQLSPKRLCSREIPSGPKSIAKALLDQENKATACVGPASPRLTWQVLGRQLARYPSYFVVRKALSIVAQIEITPCPVPPRTVP